MWSPLFVVGVARAGTTLVAELLDGHSGVAVACDPFLPLYTALRDAAVAAAGLALPPGTPLEDYYGSDERIARLDAVQAANLELLPFPGLGDALHDRLVGRASLECADLVPGLASISGPTFADAFAAALDLVRRARGGAEYVGTKEVWTIEFVPLLARAFPTARFVVVRRDARAVVASMRTLAAQDRSQRGHVLSYARHWRKEAAFLAAIERGAAAARVDVVQYEELVADPAEVLSTLCVSLGLPFEDAMLASTGSNSSYGDRGPGIDAAGAARWQRELAAPDRALVDLVCGPELALEGRATAVDLEAARAALEAERDDPVSWRSDLGDTDADLALECERRSALAGGRPDDAAIRRLFLNGDAYARLAPVSVC